MKYLIKVFLESKEDVIRDIEINSNKSFEELHFAIIDSLALDKNEMASFYITNDNFELLKEIPLYVMNEEDRVTKSMKETTISSVLTEEGNQLIYVYDFLNMWRFLVQLHKCEDKIVEQTMCIHKIGKMPKDAPKIQFEAEKEFDPFEDAFDDSDEFSDYE